MAEKRGRVFLLLVIIGVVALWIINNDFSTSSLNNTTNTIINSKPLSPTNTSSQSVSLGKTQALRKAKDYLDYKGFSKKGLIKQLEYEGFSTEDATYAVEKCGADWNYQAERTAKDYLEYSSFSRNKLIEQLEYEGFTYTQALSGVKAIGY
ncbi:MAG TPA: Ltp family lipoprotein [Edaphocola sp.]|jgi:SOS response regulatory protein OraA/RecX|nr:Ltp family lipoprotein [Edaphocola sp.]